MQDTPQNGASSIPSVDQLNHRFAGIVDRLEDILLSIDARKKRAHSHFVEGEMMTGSPVPNSTPDVRPPSNARPGLPGFAVQLDRLDGVERMLAEQNEELSALLDHIS